MPPTSARSTARARRDVGTLLVAALAFALWPAAACSSLSQCDAAVVDVRLRNSSHAAEARITFLGRFGDQSPRTPMALDTVVHVLSFPWPNRTACSAFFYNAPEATAAGAAGWLAVVQRGECGFAQKIDNALHNGAGGVVLYNMPGQELVGINHAAYRVLVVLVDYVSGKQLIDLLEEDSVAQIVIRQQDTASNGLDAITIACASAMIFAALLFNATALVSILFFTKKKLKPHLYLVVNLVVTDLQVAVVSAAQVGGLYALFHDVCPDDEARITTRCIASMLSRYWNVLLYSNMLTLLLITVEHFVACRWPLRHKVLLTRRKVLTCVVASWTCAALPDVAAIAMEVRGAAEAERPQNDGSSTGGGGGGGGSGGGSDFCRFVHRHVLGYEKWGASVVFVSIVTALLSVLFGVYGYILWIIHTASIGKLEARRKRNAVVTSLLLLVSCCVSYVFYYTLQFSVAAERRSDSSMITSYRIFLHNLFPTSPLVVDYLLTGVLGAILDPLIYCSRTKEVKSFLTRFLTRKYSSRSGSGAGTNTTRLARDPR